MVRWRLILRADGVPERTFWDRLRDPFNREERRILAANAARARQEAEEAPRKADAATLAARIAKTVKFLRQFNSRGGWLLSDGKRAVEVHTEADAGTWLKRSK